MPNVALFLQHEEQIESAAHVIADYQERLGENLRIKRIKLPPGQRALHTCSTQGMPLDVWFRVMVDALAWAGNTYNDFDTIKVYQALQSFSAIRVWPARECSVAMYILAGAENLAQIGKIARRTLRADEVEIASWDAPQAVCLRLWWD